jgi:hypothetical protein
VDVSKSEMQIMNDIVLAIGLPLVIGFLFISYCAMIEFTGWVKDLRNHSVTPAKVVVPVRVASNRVLSAR